MGKERVKRVLFISLAVGLIIMGIVRFSQRPKANGESINLPEFPFKEALENVGDKVLGEVTKKLPGAPELEKTNQADRADETDQEKKEAKPIQQPVTNIQVQTQQLIETIKKLPEDQVEAIKKQIFKDFCQEMIGE